MRTLGIRDPDLTRAALLSEGARIFADRGFDGATTEQIARAAGVNKALISYHFRGKEGLYIAILTTTFEEVNADLERIVTLPRPAGERLHELIEVFAAIHERRPGVSVLLLREVLSAGGHLQRHLLPQFLNVFAKVRRLVVEGMKEGSFRPVDPLLAHLSVIGSLVFFFATIPLRERLIEEGKFPYAIPSPEEFVRHLQEMVRRGLAAEVVPNSGD